jgi:hypothetical protein
MYVTPIATRCMVKGYIRNDLPYLCFGKPLTGDEIKTVDEIILERVASGYDVYEIKYKPPGKLQTPFGTILRDGDEETKSSAGGGDGGWFDSAVQWAVRRVTTSVNRALLDQSLSPTVEQRYMAKDDTADRINSRS